MPKKDKFLQILFLGVVATEIVFLVWLNIWHIQDGIDQDFAKLLRHVVEMSKNHTLFLDNWKYLTTGEQDCAAFLAVLFYSLTGNVYLAYGLSNIFDIFLWLFVIHRLLKSAGITKELRLLCYGFIFTTYDFGMVQYTNMLFYCGGQYAYKVLVPLLLVAILSGEAENDLVTWLVIVLYSFLTLLCSISSGAYVFVCGIFPVLVSCILLDVVKNEKKNIRKEVFFTVLSVVLVGIGLVLCNVFEIQPSSTSMLLTTFDHDVTDRVFLCINSIFSLLHPAYAGTKALSVKGIMICVNWGIIFIILCGLFGGKRLLDTFAYKRIDEEGNGRDLKTSDKMEVLLLSATLWNFVIVVLTTDSARYHLMGVIPVMICSCLEWDRFLRKHNHILRNLFLETIFGFILLFCVYNIHSIDQEYFSRSFYGDGGQRWSEKEVNSLCNVLEDENVNTCVFLNNSELAERMRASDYEHEYYSYSTESKHISIADYYYVDEEEILNEEDYIVVGQLEQFETLPETYQEQFTITEWKPLGMSVWKRK